MPTMASNPVAEARWALERAHELAGGLACSYWDYVALAAAVGLVALAEAAQRIAANLEREGP